MRCSSHMELAMNEDIVFELARHYRFQWEPAQEAYVLLYPEGMVKLGASAGEILKRVDGASAVSAIVADLERAFPGADLRGDVTDFLAHARDKGWIRVRQA
jgi:pyrroloquinoline quinone biosynthesis protein D